jgi:Family of unknown function (DUF6090)
MIKFFRKIRYDLMEQNKTGKYLKYAIGEIVLVVIGILIALQINNWNSQQKLQQQEQLYLDNLERDLILQLADIEQQLSFELTIFETTKPLLLYYKAHKTFQVDSIFTAKVGMLTIRKTVVNHNATYTELLASGGMDVFRNILFKNKLILYNQQLDRMAQIINKNNNLFTDGVFIPEVMKLSELQLSGIFTNNLTNEPFDDPEIGKDENIDLNEDQLKVTTQAILADPEKQLIFVNALNYRIHLAKAHRKQLLAQKVQTQQLLELLRNYDSILSEN